MVNKIFRAFTLTAIRGKLSWFLYGEAGTAGLAHHAEAYAPRGGNL